MDAMKKDQQLEKVEADASISHEENAGQMRAAVDPLADLKKDARGGTDQETNMKLRPALKLYWKGAMFSLILSSTIIMEGYDTSLIQSFYAMPQFNEKFGTLLADGTYQVSASWQSGLSNGYQAGQIVGLIFNGWIAEKIGYKKTMILALILMNAFIFVFYFAQNIETLLAAELTCGIPWGMFQGLTSAYASEIVPMALRPYLTTYINLCWVFGQLLASGILRAMLDRQDELAYRLPWALQWIWPGPILLAVLFAPESPWWLVRHGKIEQARKVLLRITSKDREARGYSVDNALSQIIHTNELEQKITKGTSYWNLVSNPVDRRRTEITCLVYVSQNASGAAFIAYAAYFLQQAGLPNEDAFNMTIANYALGIVGTFCSWGLFGYLGRRTIFNGGLGIMAILLFTIGIVGIPAQSSATSWAVGGLILAYTFIYDSTVGPATYTIISEMSSTRLRPKTIVVARAAYIVMGIINAVLMPKMINPSAWNWAAKTGFFWAGLCAVCLVYCYFRLPETRGRTYGQLDALFEHRVSARKFHKTEIDVGAEEIPGVGLVPTRDGTSLDGTMVDDHSRRPSHAVEEGGKVQ